MIFNLFKSKPKQDFDYISGGLTIKRVPNKRGDVDMRVRIEVGNKDFISLANCLHIGRSAQLVKHEEDPVNNPRFNSRINKQINTLRYLSTALVNEHRAKKGQPLVVDNESNP